MKGSWDTYEYGTNDMDLQTVRFLANTDHIRAWEATKDFDTLVSILCASKGKANRILGNNGQAGATYTCYYTIQMRGDRRDKAMTLRYQIISVDETNRKVSMKITEDCNGSRVSTKDTTLSVIPYVSNSKLTVFCMEWKETKSWSNINTVVTYGEFFIMFPAIASIYCLYAIICAKSIWSEFLDIVESLKIHLGNYQMPVSQVQQGAPIVDAVQVNDTQNQEVKYAQEV
eukprot:snap_masked-scaffold_10-processed-gene-7.15-mRNA-1 protein AED:0.17 eAED:1.00 QI:0/0/0/1/1/1/2/0/228